MVGWCVFAVSLSGDIPEIGTFWPGILWDVTLPQA